jgi:hypothetical protein
VNHIEIGKHMTRNTVIILGCMLLLAGPGNAYQTISVDSVWFHAAGGWFVNNQTVGDQDIVRWGFGLDHGRQSGLGFTGATGEFGNDPFLIGQLVHGNRVIWSGTGISSVDLSFDVATDVGVFQFGPQTLMVDEIPNWGSYTEDTISLPAFGSAITNGYTLNILGFGDDPDHLVSQLTTPERDYSTTYLWGQMMGPASIPAPAAIMMAAIGIIPIVLRDRKRIK